MVIEAGPVLSCPGVGVAVAFVEAARIGVGAVNGDFDQPATSLRGPPADGKTVDPCRSVGAGRSVPWLFV
jgi:hypothetical protein